MVALEPNMVHVHYETSPWETSVLSRLIHRHKRGRECGLAAKPPVRLECVNAFLFNVLQIVVGCYLCHVLCFFVRRSEKGIFTGIVFSQTGVEHDDAVKTNLQYMLIISFK